MTDEQINIAIAESLGWRDCHKSLATTDDSLISERKPVGIPPKKLSHHLIPNYCNDLNAMHEAEKVLNKNQESMYYDRLCSIAGVDAYRAPARPRAEAFCKAMNLGNA